LIPGEWLLIDELAYVEDGYLSQDGVTISKNGCYLWYRGNAATEI